VSHITLIRESYHTHSWVMSHTCTMNENISRMSVIFHGIFHGDIPCNTYDSRMIYEMWYDSRMSVIFHGISHGTRMTHSWCNTMNESCVLLMHDSLQYTTHLYVCLTCEILHVWSIGWRRPIGCLRLQVISRKRATNYRALLRKMTYNDTAWCGSSPPCIIYNVSYKSYFIYAILWMGLTCGWWLIAMRNSFLCVPHKWNVAYMKYHI